MNKTNIPLVSIALFTYNQENFIAEAISGAFNQDYPNLEIIISDDCSTDNTFEVIKNQISSIETKHDVIFLQNKENLGIGNHINNIFKIAKGDLIVVMAGDDISEINRVSKLVKLWLSKENVKAVYSDVNIIDTNSFKVGEYRRKIDSKDLVISNAINTFADGVLGCSAAWSKDIFRIFGPLKNKTVCEDRTFQFRALLLGDILHTEEKLVRWRHHSSNISVIKPIDNDGVLRVAIEQERRNINILENFIDDIKKINLSNKEYYTSLIRKKIKLRTLKREFYKGNRWGRISIFFHNIFSNIPLTQKAGWLYAILFPKKYMEHLFNQRSK